MIIPMKKVNILCLTSDQEKSLEKIRELGILHVEYEKLNDSKDRAELAAKFATVERTSGLLSTRKPKQGQTSPLKEGDKIFEKADALLKELSELDKENDKMRRYHEALKPWGHFSPELLKELKEKGVFVYLCEATEKQYESFKAENDYATETISEEKGKARFAVISREELDAQKLPLANVPEDASLEETEKRLDEIAVRKSEIQTELDALAAGRKELEEYVSSVREEMEFRTNRDGMDLYDKIASINGFIPEHEVENLSKSAKEFGWALVIDDPAPDDRVPTLIKIPKVFRLVKPLFDFLGISPGYDEIDVSVSVLFFFTIFFGMIVGDAGYGSLFLVAAIAAKVALRTKKQLQLPINLFIVLSLSTVTWGALSGNWFGLSAPGLKGLTDETVKSQNTQAFCFALAVAQLTLGHLWQAVVGGKIRKALGQIGWALILWGNFFLTMNLIVFPGNFPTYMYVLYGAGVTLVVLCDVNWLDMSEVFNFPFGLIGSFVDMLSYIRLFAVGMAGYYIASSFNDMGSTIWHIQLEWYWFPLLLIGGVFVILFGHVLNIALCLMGVLVHGVRLNTLEFSNHIGLRWAGFEYKPFKKNNYIEGDSENGQ
jgi:V/A-type H+-transporting ATPase subunit I